jgi:hypothetical protein
MFFAPVGQFADAAEAGNARSPIVLQSRPDGLCRAVLYAQPQETQASEVSGRKEPPFRRPCTAVAADPYRLRGIVLRGFAGKRRPIRGQIAGIGPIG